MKLPIRTDYTTLGRVNRLCWLLIAAFVPLVILRCLKRIEIDWALSEILAIGAWSIIIYVTYHWEEIFKKR